MPYSNIGEMKAKVADTLNREDLTAVIPDFIRQAQERIRRDRRLTGHDAQFYTQSTIAVASQKNPVTVVPVGAEVNTFVVDGKVIPYVTIDEYLREREHRNYRDGVWTYIEGDVHYSNWFASWDPATPTEGEPQSIEVVGWNEATADPADDAATDWIFDNYPSALLYAALVEAAIYLDNDPRAAIFDARYDGAANEYQKDARRRAVVASPDVNAPNGDYFFDRSR